MVCRRLQKRMSKSHFSRPERHSSTLAEVPTPSIACMHAHALRSTHASVSQACPTCIRNQTLVPIMSNRKQRTETKPGRLPMKSFLGTRTEEKKEKPNTICEAISLSLTSHSFSVTLFTLSFRLFFYSAANKPTNLIFNGGSTLLYEPSVCEARNFLSFSLSSFITPTLNIHLTFTFRFIDS